ncbi:MAG TPA: aromatic amino acid ammonia-lyase [Steroidobacteraceae bacterium]|nr:aromatic amino acid ammonia-lyase [Steroidobacteraceae bacterium]
MITIRGSGLTLNDIAVVARGERVELTRDAEVHQRVEASRRFIVDAVDNGQAVYGVTTLFGGMAHRAVPQQMARDLSRHAIWSHKTVTGERLPGQDVRAAMLLRANSLLHGISGVRLEIIERFVAFLNANALPHVYELGSIGASGDLVPLAYIAGALLGVDREFRVDLDGETLDSHAALARLGLEPLALEPKEGLALVNGTSVSTGIAANCVTRAQSLLSLSLALHALYVQALRGTDQSYHPFIHEHKPHPGQKWAAAEMLRLLKGSRLIHDESSGDRQHRKGGLIQDRYSLRCLPQYLGPIVDGLDTIRRQIETEANSANDNPLIDPAAGTVFHCGNFLAQYTAVAMDQLRYYVGLLAKHLDVQIALLVMPEFSNGLTPSLIGNPDHPLNVGFKSLQVVNHSIMPLLTYYGSSLVDHFPTHAEQFNQNINSQAMGSANLARRSLDLFEHYLANALLFAVQAVELRTQVEEGHYDARRCLSPATARLYETVRTVIGSPVGGNRPLIWNDSEQSLEPLVRELLADISKQGRVVASLHS